MNAKKMAMIGVVVLLGTSGAVVKASIVLTSDFRHVSSSASSVFGSYGGNSSQAPFGEAWQEVSQRSGNEWLGSMGVRSYSCTANQTSQILSDVNGAIHVLASGSASTSLQGYMAGSAGSYVDLTFTLDQPYTFVLLGNNMVNGGRSDVIVSVEFAQVSKSIEVALYSSGSDSFTLNETGILEPGTYSLTGYAESSKNDPWGYYPFNPDLSSTYGTATLNLDLTLTPVPEPATLILLAFGGLAILRKRR
jgi:hypothetical protein